ncbi:hypothetical protein [Rhodococcus rhodochrous]
MLRFFDGEKGQRREEGTSRMKITRHALQNIRSNLENELATVGSSTHTRGYRRGLHDALAHVVALQDTTDARTPH